MVGIAEGTSGTACDQRQGTQPVEGPGASLLRLGDVPLIHASDDARFALLGGTFVGEGALLRFYVLHCVGLPLAIAVLMAVHFWRVRKDGGISGPL